MATKQKELSQAKKIEIELIRSPIGTPEWMRTIVWTLKLRKLRARVTLTDNPAIRGMIKKVHHLVSVRELGASA